MTWNWRLIVQEQECAEQTGEKYREKEKWEQKEEIRVKNCRGKQKNKSVIRLTLGRELAVAQNTSEQGVERRAAMQEAARP